MSAIRTDGRLELVIEIQVEEGLRERFLEVIDRCRNATLREPGCGRYDLYSGVDDVHSFLLAERWTDRASLQAHFETEHFGALLAAVSSERLTLRPPSARICGEPIPVPAAIDRSGQSGEPTHAS